MVRHQMINRFYRIGDSGDTTQNQVSPVKSLIRTYFVKRSLNWRASDFEVTQVTHQNNTTSTLRVSTGVGNV